MIGACHGQDDAQIFYFENDWEEEDFKENRSSIDRRGSDNRPILFLKLELLHVEPPNLGTVPLHSLRRSPLAVFPGLLQEKQADLMRQTARLDLETLAEDSVEPLF